MSSHYTNGVWKVKAGKADEFIAAWTEMAEWTAANARGAGQGTLLRDLSDQNRFVSFGPWESEQAIDSWRAMDGFKERVSRMRELLESFEPSTLELVSEKG